MNVFMTTVGQERKSAALLSDDRGASRAYRAGWASIALAIPMALGILDATEMTLALTSAVPLLFCTVLLAAAHLRYRCSAPDVRLAMATGALAMLICAGMLAGIISNAGLRLRRPLIDDLLSTLDTRIGVDTAQLVLAFSGYARELQVLAFAYSSTLPLCFIVILCLAVRGQVERAWEAAGSFSVCIVGSSLFGAIYPAIGNFWHANLDATTVVGLPRGSGTFYLPAFVALYDGTDPVLDLTRLEGVVTFPSFHFVMALILGWAMRGNGLLSWVMIFWSATIAASTIPIGGHYVVDLLGGFALWIAVIASLHVSRPLTQAPLRLFAETRRLLETGARKDRVQK